MTMTRTTETTSATVTLDAIRKAARTTQPWTPGGDLAYISDVWRAYTRQGGRATLRQFQAVAVQEFLAGRLELTEANLLSVMDHAKLRESACGNGWWQMMRIR